MSFTINADDPKTIKAVELAANADHWLKGHNQAGEAVYGVPSQSEAGRYYIVTSSSCDCPDFQHQTAQLGLRADQRPCKHLLAARLHDELVRAQQSRPTPRDAPRRRGHLSVVP